MGTVGREGASQAHGCLESSDRSRVPEDLGGLMVLGGRGDMSAGRRVETVTTFSELEESATALFPIRDGS